MNEDERQEEGAGSAENPVEEQEAGAQEQWEPGAAHSAAGDAAQVPASPLPDEDAALPEGDRGQQDVRDVPPEGARDTATAGDETFPPREDEDDEDEL